MPSRKPSDDPSAWTVGLLQGPDCSIGYSANEAMNWDGTSSSGRQNEDRHYTCIHQNSIQLFVVLDGHDGSKAVKFARTYIPHHLLQSDLMGGGDKKVMDALRNAIVNTERQFFIGVDPYITRKVTLQFEIEQKVPEADSSTALRLFPSQIGEISRLDDLIKGGTTVVAALIYDSKLYVANVGDSRALLCSQSRDGTLLSVQQLSVDHNTGNEEELRRLERCGLDPNALRRAKRLGMQQNTRSIGDYSIKGGYTNVDIIRHAICEPGTAEPYLHEPISIATFHGFLILMSDGLYEAYEAWTRRPDKINEDIAHLVAQELKVCGAGDFNLVAQQVVDKVKVLYRDTCKRDHRSGRLDDITLIVKSLGGVSTLMRSQSSVLPYHLQHQHPSSQAPPTAPVTDKHFDFAPHQGPPYMPQAEYWAQPRYPDPRGQPRGQPRYPDAHPYAPRSGYYGDPWRGDVPRGDPYNRNPRYSTEYGSTMDPSFQGNMAPQAPQGSYRPYPPGGESLGYHDRPPPQSGGHDRPPPQSGGYYPPYAHQPPPPQPPQQPPQQLLGRQDPAETWQEEYSPRKNNDRPFTPPATTDFKPQQATPSSAGGTEAQTTTPPAAPPFDHSQQAQTTPPAPSYDHPRQLNSSSLVSTSSVEGEGAKKAATMSTLNEDADLEMYGWSGQAPPEEQRSLQGEPPGGGAETGPPCTPQAKAPPLEAKAPPLEKQDADKIVVDAAVELEDSEHDDYIIIDDELEQTSSLDEEEDQDGCGTIRPYIKFSEHFPLDISWSDIKIDPSSS